MSEQRRWDGGERLRRAIGLWHGGDQGVERFVKSMQAFAPGVPGTNRAMVQRYLSGKALPSLPFLEHAADLLGVRFEYLAINQGPERSPADFPEMEQLYAERAIIPHVPAFEHWPHSARLPFIHLVERYVYSFRNAREELGDLTMAEKDPDDPNRWDLIDWESIGVLAAHLKRHLFMEDLVGLRRELSEDELVAQVLSGSARMLPLLAGLESHRLTLREAVAQVRKQNAASPPPE